MTYQEADRLLQGRCRDSRKIGNNTYLQRDIDGLSVRFHSTNILTFKADGSIRVTNGGYETVTTKARLNTYLPHGYHVWSGGKEFGPVSVLYGVGNKPLALIERALTINPDGSLTGGGDLGLAGRAWKEEVNAGRRERYREQFWIRKARQGGKLRRPLTLEMIQAEANVSTRMAMIKVYGLERFLVAVNAAPLDVLGEYSLLTYPVDSVRLWPHIRALKMVCPSTKTVYIHPVDPACSTVAKALDWMFQTEGYLDRLQTEA
jgi:hypothetical protein